MNDLTSCNNCIKVTGAFDTVDAICNSCANRVKALLNLDFTVSSFKIYEYFGRLQAIVSGAEELGYKADGQLLLRRSGADLDQRDIELLLAPAHLQNTYIEVQEFIT